jgi:C1A family cysteine protease
LDHKKCTPKQNHAVLAVGYGFDPVSDQNYFIIKNSWGKWWGENGYFRISADPKYDD